MGTAGLIFNIGATTVTLILFVIMLIVVFAIPNRFIFKSFKYNWLQFPYLYLFDRKTYRLDKLLFQKANDFEFLGLHNNPDVPFIGNVANFYLEGGLECNGVTYDKVYARIWNYKDDLTTVDNNDIFNPEMPSLSIFGKQGSTDSECIFTGFDRYYSHKISQILLQEIKK